MIENVIKEAVKGKPKSHNTPCRLLGGVLTALALLGAGGRGYAVVGAVTPFTCVEAESGLTGGGASVVYLTSAPATQYSSPQLEASGHAYVQLTDVGQSVTITNVTGQNITAINVRSCIPDAPTGWGTTSTINLYVNGAFRQAFSVNSMQSYCYEGTNYNGQADKNPADGNPRGFWNDTHAFIAGAAVAPGDTITLQKDATNAAAFYYIDVVDLENPPAPLTQPGNSLSIVAYGAVSNNIGVDNTTMVNNCFNAAKAQGKSVWIPPGVFYFSAIHGGLHATAITIEGAGPWYSTLYRVTPTNNTQGVSDMITADSSELRNVALDCNGAHRGGNNNNGAVNFSGNNWLVDNVWIQHATSAFWCSGIGGTAQNCRVLSVWSDGGNFNNVQGTGGVGMNLTYTNNFVRGTGDDAMAINSVDVNGTGNNATYYTIMSNISYVNNTAACSWGGKNMAIYGGINQLVTNNFLHDNARYIGLGVSKFGVNGSGLFSAQVMGNTVLRCGGNGYLQQQPAMMIGNGGDGQGVGTVANAYCASNIIIGAVFSGVGFTSGTNNVFQCNTITSPGQNGIMVGGGSLGTGVTGTAMILSNTVTGLGAGRVALINSASGYAVIIPKLAANYDNMSGVAVETCGEGGLDVGNIEPGDWTAYNNVNLTGLTTFVARVASGGSGGMIEVRLDGVNGTLVGTCAVPGTGGPQMYTDVFCGISTASGSHAVYLVYNGGGGDLFNVEWFGFFNAPPAFSHQLVPGNTYALKSLANGNYVSADSGSGYKLIAESAVVGVAEQFQIADAGSGNIGFLALATNRYVSAGNAGATALVASPTGIGSWETFTELDAGGGNVAIQAQVNHKYVSAGNAGTTSLIANQTNIGNGESFSVEFVNGVPPARPGNLTALPGNAQAVLNWMESPGATSYNVKRAMSNGGPYVVVVTNVPGVSYTNSGLVNGTTYYFAVSAQNLAGESTNSPQAYATPGTLNRLGWVASSSTSGNDVPGNALDGNFISHWSTDAFQASGQWFQVDLGAVYAFNKIVLNSTNSPSDYPRNYLVSVSMDGINWGSPVVGGSGVSAITTIAFPTLAARYVRITLTSNFGASYWSINEFNVFGAPPLAPTGLTATAVSASQVNLSWDTSASATGYNLKWATVSGGPYAVIGTNLTGTSYGNIGLSSGVTYYYVVTATNGYGEGVSSAEAGAQLVSTTPVALHAVTGGSAVQFDWPADHQGWRLEAQTNAPGVGIGNNWATVPNSQFTNRVSVPVTMTNGSVFFRLTYP